MWTILNDSVVNITAKTALNAAGRRFRQEMQNYGD